MPDITMCTNSKCEKKDKCYRYTAKPNQNRQSYCGFINKDGKCEHFISNDRKDEKC
jgi:hypothetical protein